VENSAKKEQRKTVRICSIVENLTWPTKTALQCLIDHCIIVWILQDTAGQKAVDEIFSFYRKKLNESCLHLESVPRMPLISGIVPVAPAVLPGGMARVNRHNLQKPRLL
jgi:hypothetical protein